MKENPKEPVIFCAECGRDIYVLKENSFSRCPDCWQFVCSACSGKRTHQTKCGLNARLNRQAEAV